MAELRTGIYGKYYGSLSGHSEPLNTSQMQTNARYIFSSLSDEPNPWSINAICAVLGNMEAESSINPGRWQSDNPSYTSGGYGLVQWTPSTKYTDWAHSNGITDPSTMDANISRMLYEVEAGGFWIPTSNYNFSYREFTTSNKSVSELAKAFLLNFERPADQSTLVQNKRANMAKAWYEFLLGFPPSEPDPEPSNPYSKKKKKKFNFILFNVRRRKQWNATKY